MSTTRTEVALLLLALLAPPLEALTQHTQQQRHLVFAPGSDWEFAYKYIEDACPNINPRSGRPGDGEWISASVRASRNTQISHPP
jgi:hypothetical protein